MLCRDAAQIIKTMLAGTATHRLTDVVEASFGGEEPKDIQEDYEEAKEEEVKLPSETPISEPGTIFERLILFTVDNKPEVLEAFKKLNDPPSDGERTTLFGLTGKGNL